MAARGVPSGGKRAPARATPLHARVYEAVRRGIANGRIRIGAELPSEAEIGRQHAASRITVRHALQRLEQEGYVRKRHGARTVVVSADPAAREGWRTESIDDIVAAADDATLDIRSFRRERAPGIAPIFAEKPGVALTCLRSVLRRDGRPFARSIIYFRPDIGAQLKRGHFDDVIVFRVVQRQTGVAIGEVRMTVRAMLADEADIAELGCTAGEPVVETMLVYRAGDGPPVEVALTRRRAADFSLSYTLRAGGG